MFEQGKIKAYNVDEGFGFIGIQGKSNEVFFQLSDLPSPHILPEVGEELRFRKILQQGQVKAGQITRLNVQSTEITEDTKRKPNLISLPKMIFLIIFVAVLVIGLIGFSTYQNHQIEKQQQVDLLIQQQQHIIAAQRAAVEDLSEPDSKQREKEILKNPGTEFNQYQNSDQDKEISSQ